MSKSANKQPSPQPMQQHLLSALASLDRQVARHLAQSSSAQMVGRSTAISSRVELVSSLIIDEFSEGHVGLDSLLIASQSLTKALAMISSELGEENLGKVMSACCIEAFRQISNDAERAMATLDGKQFVN